MGISLVFFVPGGVHMSVLSKYSIEYSIVGGQKKITRVTVEGWDFGLGETIYTKAANAVLGTPAHEQCTIMTLVDPWDQRNFIGISVDKGETQAFVESKDVTRVKMVSAHPGGVYPPAVSANA
jgi:hypothetical protein